MDAIHSDDRGTLIASITRSRAGGCRACVARSCPARPLA
jgi:hypothetical protein